MKNSRQLAVRLSKRMWELFIVIVFGYLAASAILLSSLLLWLLGLVVIPIAIFHAWIRFKQQWYQSKSPKFDDIELPRWAQWWDDTSDIGLRGRPASILVWQHDVSWPIATFLYLQFYNPLANLRIELQKRNFLMQ